MKTNNKNLEVFHDLFFISIDTFEFLSYLASRAIWRTALFHGGMHVSGPGSSFVESGAGSQAETAHSPSSG